MRKFPHFHGLFPCSVSIQITHRLVSCQKKCMTGHLLGVFGLLLLNASDCHPNPGPRQVRFPCEVCSKACRWSKTIRSIVCSGCDKWFHKNCLSRKTAVYNALTNTDIRWYCCNCGLPNFSTSLFEDYEFSSTDHDTIQTSVSLVYSFGDFSLIGPPQITTSPNKGKLN